MTDPGLRPPSSADPAPVRPTWHVLWVGVLGLSAWTRWLSPWWLLLPSATVLIWLIRRPPARTLQAVSALLVLLGVLVGFAAHNQLGGPGERGESLLVHREEEVSRALTRRFETLLSSGERALQETLDLLATGDPENLQDEVGKHVVNALNDYSKVKY